MKSLQLNDRGPQVSALQRSLRQLGYDVGVDGHFGRKTLAAVQAYAVDRTKKGAPGWEIMAIHDEATNLQTAQSIKTVGAWCGPAALKKPRNTVNFAAKNGINRIDIVVNDHSKWRTDKPFDIFNRAQIVALANAAAAKGIEVHLMSWVMPFENYIESAAEILIPLCKDTGAASLMWDAEEPWNQATNAMTHRAAAKFLGQKFANLSCPMGITGIGFAPVAKLGPLAELCDYAVPQVYVTSGSGLKPEKAPGRFYERWSKNFRKPIVMGLAAYKQTGVPGHPSIESAMGATIEATRGLDVDTIVYWSMRWIQKTAAVAEVVKGIRG